MNLETVLVGLRAAGESTRLRLLAVLERAELTVTEITRVLGQSQPRVSRHLKLMCDAGLLHRTQEGAWAFYRLADSGEGARIARALLELISSDDPEMAGDMVRLERIKREHSEAAAEYFRANAQMWDVLRGLYGAAPEVDRAMLDAIGDCGIDNLLDLGTGTGQVLCLLAERTARGLGIDSSREILTVARANLEAANLRHCRVRQGDIYRLAVAPGSMDVVTIHHVLHFLYEPALAVSEAARTLRAGGRMLIVDFAPHEVERLRTEHAHRRLGFEDSEVRAWCKDAGLSQVRGQRFEGAASVGDERLSVCLWTAVQSPPTGKSRGRPSGLTRAVEHHI